MQSALVTSHFSTRKIINAESDDRIFVFYSDHGAPGLLGMPSGDFLYADQLHAAVLDRHRRRGFKEMVLYIEACESGSMFDGLLENHLDVYATTAANGRESSWGVYCPGMVPGPPPEFSVCLGDLYSVSWMEDAENNNINDETLKKQFDRVKSRTSKNFTFLQGSHVMMYGEIEIDKEPVAWYLGDPDSSNSLISEVNSGVKNADDTDLNGMSFAVEQRDAELMPLIFAARHSDDPVSKSIAKQSLDREVERRKLLDTNVFRAVEKVASDEYFANNIEASMLMSVPIPAPVGNALVSDWDCLRNMMQEWQEACGQLDQYGMKHSRVFANLCNLGIKKKSLFRAASAVCQSK